MNKKEPKSFILYCNFENQFKLLSLEERGILISAIFEYARERKFECELPPLVNMAFSLIKDTMDRDYEEYMERCEINAINGRKGGRPRKIEESDVPTFTPKTERFFEKPKKAYNDNENYNGNNNENKNDIDNGSGNGNGNGNDNDNDNDNNENGEKRKSVYTPRVAYDEKTGEEISIAEFCKRIIASCSETPPSSACSADSVQSVQEEKKEAEEDISREPTHEVAIRYALSERERANLVSRGIPESYIKERADRACDFGMAQKKSAYSVLLEWWEKDREMFGKYHTTKKSEKMASDEKSYNTDDFFEAACRRSREEFGFKS